MGTLRHFTIEVAGLESDILNSSPEILLVYLQTNYPDMRLSDDWKVVDNHRSTNLVKLARLDLPLDGYTNYDELQEDVRRHAKLITGLDIRPWSSYMMFPSVLDGSDQECHPLVAWWAILFSLSMLARYSPSSWSDDLNVDENESAVALEDLISKADGQVSILLNEVLHHVFERDEEAP